VAEKRERITGEGGEVDARLGGIMKEGMAGSGRTAGVGAGGAIEREGGAALADGHCRYCTRSERSIARLEAEVIRVIRVIRLMRVMRVLRVMSY